MSVPPAPPVPEPQAHPGPRPGPKIGPSERLSATLALSLITFGVLILGVGFVQDEAAPVMPTLDVILTQTKTETPPDDADFIAQANNRGGGDRDKSLRPRESQVSTVPKPQPGIAPRPMIAQAPPPAIDPQQRVLTTTRPTDFFTAPPEDQADSLPTPLPTGRELMARTPQLARMAAEVDRKQELYAKRPKRKFVSASTKEYEYAAYIRAWFEKVERVSNMNCPRTICGTARTGVLELTVAVKRDGTLGEITINSSSGDKLLDNAAIRGVRLSAPFPPLPKGKDDFDELMITRAWRYNNGDLDTY